MQGIIVEYDAATRFGAIQCQSLGGLVAVRPSSASIEEVALGDLVSFELGRPDGIPQAINMQLISRGFHPSSSAASSPSRAPSPAPAVLASVSSPHLQTASKQPVPPPYASPMPPAERLAPSNTTSKPKAQEPSARREGREECASCGKFMVPRLVTHKGKPTASFCPFCAAQHRDFTAAGDGGIGQLVFNGLVSLLLLGILAALFL